MSLNAPCLEHFIPFEMILYKGTFICIRINLPSGTQEHFFWGGEKTKARPILLMSRQGYF